MYTYIFGTPLAISVTISFIMYVLSALLVVSFALAAQGFTPYIVGGNEALLGKYPYQVSIRYYNDHLCGGSIINKRYILTAAHCLKRLEYMHRLTVHAGTNFLNETGDVYKVEDFKYHDGYSRIFLVNDIGLVRVAEDIKYNDLVQPITLATTDFVSDGQPCVVSGWGFTQVDGESSNSLKELNVFIQSQAKCHKKHWRVGDTHICTFTKYGEGVCDGDSGSPLVMDGIQIGVVSFSRPCGVGYPDVYTKVSAFQEWIKENIQDI